MASCTVVPAESLPDDLWRRLEAAVADDTHSFHTLVLCTTDADHAPHARIMTLRKVDPSSNRLWVHARHGSAKVAELTLNPAWAGVFFDPRDSVQVRVRGAAACHRLDDTAVAEFQRAGTGSAVRRGPGSVPVLPDLLWPGSPDALQHAITRRAFREFAVIELAVQEITWLQVAATDVVHVSFRVGNGFRPEPAHG